MNGARSCNSSGMWALLQRSAKNGTFDIECTRRPNPKSKKTECCDFGRGPGGCGGQCAGFGPPLVPGHLPGRPAGQDRGHRRAVPVPLLRARDGARQERRYAALGGRVGRGRRARRCRRHARHAQAGRQGDCRRQPGPQPGLSPHPHAVDRAPERWLEVGRHLRLKPHCGELNLAKDGVGSLSRNGVVEALPGNVGRRVSSPSYRYPARCSTTCWRALVVRSRAPSNPGDRLVRYALQITILTSRLVRDRAKNKNQEETWSLKGGTVGGSTAVQSSVRRFIVMAVVLSGASPALLAATSAVDQGTGPEDTLQEVVVTATKSAANLRDVPIAITAFTGADLRDQGVSNVNALGRFVPSVNLDTSTAFSGSRSVLSASIRGIGLDDFALNLDPAVGVYIDGVYLARTIGANSQLLDVERVEVLRGPQGTLFGRNTIGGAISIVTRDPKDHFAATGDVTIGTFNRAYNDCLAVLTIASVSSPLICGARAQVGTGLFGANLNPATSRLTWGSQYVTGNIDTSYANGINFVHVTNYGGALTTEIAFTDALTLRSITGYRDLYFANGDDNDGSPLQFYESTYSMWQHQFSQELQLLGKTLDNRLTYLLGGYYFDENGEDNQDVIFAQGLQQINVDTNINTRTEAGFARGSFQATDQLSFTLGGRITSEQKKLASDSRELNGYLYRNFGCYPGDSPSPVPGLSCQQFVSSLGKQVFQDGTFDFPVAGDPNRFSPLGTSHLTSNVFTWTGGAEYHLMDKSLLYTSYSTGFKSGGWTTRLIFPSSTESEFGPEKSATLEVGFKSSLLQNRLSTDVALFSTLYKDTQLPFIAPGFGTPVTMNAGTARINGAELEASAIVVHGLKMSSSLAYLDARYTELQAGATGITLGSDLPKTPKWKASLSPQYTFPVFRGEFRAALQYTYTSSLYNDTENTPLLRLSLIHISE